MRQAPGRRRWKWGRRSRKRRSDQPCRRSATLGRFGRHDVGSRRLDDTSSTTCPVAPLARDAVGNEAQCERNGHDPDRQPDGVGCDFARYPPADRDGGGECEEHDRRADGQDEDPLEPAARSGEPSQRGAEHVADDDAEREKPQGDEDVGHRHPPDTRTCGRSRGPPTQHERRDNP